MIYEEDDPNHPVMVIHTPNHRTGSVTLTIDPPGVVQRWILKLFGFKWEIK